MGCDIHIVMERRRPGGAWELVGKAEKEGYPTMPEVWRGRNYDIFALLADVRNGSGFAGCDTGDGFVPIAMPRGIPDDASPAVKEWVQWWDGDGHSHSWLTLADLEAYDWERGTRSRGYVGPAEFAEYEKNGKPRSWCGMVDGDLVRHVSNDEMRAAIRGGKAHGPEHLYTQVSWEIGCRETSAPFLDQVGPLMRGQIAEGYEVRLVFFFDN